jgi:hypothetical protein
MLSSPFCYGVLSLHLIVTKNIHFGTLALLSDTLETVPKAAALLSTFIRTPFGHDPSWPLISGVGDPPARVVGVGRCLFNLILR